MSVMARDPPYDPFTEIPVTGDAAGGWCLAVARLGPDSWRHPYYVRDWTGSDL